MNTMLLNYFDCFATLTWGGRVLLGKAAYPLGQIATDYLNLDSRVFQELCQRVEHFVPLMRRLLNGERTMIDQAQRSMNAVWDVLRNLPPYRDLPMDLASAYNALLPLEEDDGAWSELVTDGTERRQAMERFLSGIETMPDRLGGFRTQVSGMLELYFEELPRRNAAAYGKAFASYYDGAQSMSGFFLPDMDVAFEQSFDTAVRFVPIHSPDNPANTVVGEETKFDDLVSFLYADFYRGLAVGNAPRRCHNCGRYFLLTDGYNTCYCNNIAPGETKRTCRKVGAHRKEAQGKANRSPAKKEYDRAYNRLKARKQRSKISVDEWNTAVAQAQELVAQSERGELTDDELRKKLEQL